MDVFGIEGSGINIGYFARSKTFTRSRVSISAVLRVCPAKNMKWSELNHWQSVIFRKAE